MFETEKKLSKEMSIAGRNTAAQSTSKTIVNELIPDQAHFS